MSSTANVYIYRTGISSLILLFFALDITYLLTCFLLLLLVPEILHACFQGEASLEQNWINWTFVARAKFLSKFYCIQAQFIAIFFPSITPHHRYLIISLSTLLCSTFFYGTGRKQPANGRSGDRKVKEMKKKKILRMLNEKKRNCFIKWWFYAWKLLSSNITPNLCRLMSKK